MSKVKKATQSSEEFTSSSCSSSSVSSDDETDAQDLKSIKDYMGDRREMARQLFKSVKLEKIRMMLPQTLKKVDMNELEELCANELSGMSRARIMCILNGKDMLESSNTSESDESGPSLEIISDTEEWFSDEDVKKEDWNAGKVKSKREKGKGKLQKKNNTEKSKIKAKANKFEQDEKLKDIKIKSETEHETNKEKEGDSLLDLLELEMRARAIRALIRKEEDIIPNANASKSTSNESTKVNSSNKTSQDDQKEKEICRRQLEKIISAQQGGGAEDEDVVLVVEPTPTIELLSSESETEDNAELRANKKLNSERVKSGEKLKTKQSDINPCAKDASAVVCDAHQSQLDAEPVKHDSESSHNQSDHSGEKRKKSHKRSRTKDRDRSKISKSEDKQKPNLNETSSNTDNRAVPPDNTVVDNTSNANVASNVELSSRPIEEKKTQIQEPRQKPIPDEDKSTDMDEIIDLDDYSDDMEDMENFASDKSKTKPETPKPQKAQPVATPGPQKPGSAETWASRYYQTDDVQSVIKESKIQSEIRKRLRERQRLSKLNKSPNIPSPSPLASDAPSENTVQKPTGSVDEYLALKRGDAVNLNTHGNCGSDSSQEGTSRSDSRADANVAPVLAETHTSQGRSEGKGDNGLSSVNTDVSTSPDSTVPESQRVGVNNKTNFA